MHQNPQSVFSNHKQMVQHSILSLVVKTMEQCVIPTLDSYVTIITFFIYGYSNLDMTCLFL
jgi:hypothetical protein